MAIHYLQQLTDVYSQAGPAADGREREASAVERQRFMRQDTHGRSPR